MKFKMYGEKLDNFILKQQVKFDRKRLSIAVQGGKMVLAGHAVKVIFQLCNENDSKMRSEKKKELNMLLLGLDATNYINPKRK